MAAFLSETSKIQANIFAYSKLAIASLSLVLCTMYADCYRDAYCTINWTISVRDENEKKRKFITAGSPPK